MEEITSLNIFQFMLIFTRIAAYIMVMPAIGESYIYQKGKLVLALSISLLMFSTLQHNMPNMPSSVTSLTIIIIKEVTIGLFLGLLTQIIFSALHTTGFIISYQIGFSAATIMDPSQKTQSSVIGSFLTTLAVMLIFATNLHHSFLRAIIDSYNVFPTNESINLANMLETIASKVNQIFAISVKFASPHIAVGLLLYLGSSVIGRLVPQMQVFFVIMPINILIGILIIALTISTVMMWFMDIYYQEVTNYFQP